MVVQKTVCFKSEGLNLVGHLYRPLHMEAGKQYGAIICSGGWTTVKEQMAGLYARRLAETGLVSLAFDFRNYGESEGFPRAWENPRMKIQDIKNAAAFLQSLPEVDPNNIGAIGICAGAMYTLMAAAKCSKIKAVVTVASWIHNAEALRQIYGGDSGIQQRIKAARIAKKKYAELGEHTYVKAISRCDETAAMVGDNDYFLNPKRGAIPQWNAHQFAVATWEDWLNLDPFPSAEQLTRPLCMIHSDGCVLPQYTKHYFDKVLSKDKSLFWIDTCKPSPKHQSDFYDHKATVADTIKIVCTFFKRTLD